MKLDTEEKKMAYFLGYFQALAECHAREFNRDVESVKQEIINFLEDKTKKK